MVSMAEDERWMTAAVALAREGLRAGELPIGAVVVAHGEVVGSAHTAEHGEKRLLVHAELRALDEADRNSGWDRTSSTLYTTLEPCLMCLGAAAVTMVGRVVFAIPSASDGATHIAKECEAGRSSLQPYLRLPSISSGIGKMAAAALFAQYVEERNGDDPMARWAAMLLTNSAP